MGTSSAPLEEKTEWETEMEKENIHLRGTYGEVVKIIQEQEIRQILSEADYKTAAGIDGLPVGIYKMVVMHAKEGDNTDLKAVTTIVRFIVQAEGRLSEHKEGIGKILWKKEGNENTTNMRPITLHNALGKIASKVIAQRLSKVLSERKILHRANEGFLNNKGTGNAIHTMLNMWEDAKQNNKSCYNLLYDVSGAYDGITHEQIKRGMEILHLPEEIQNYVMNKMSGNTYKIKTEYGLTEAFEILRGCAQGCPLSPIIYVIAMNPLHVGLEKNPLYKGEESRNGYIMEGKRGEGQIHIASKGYADDTFITSSTKEGLK